MLSNTYVEAAINERTCREWFQRFKNGDFDVEDQLGVVYYELLKSSETITEKKAKERRIYYPVEHPLVRMHDFVQTCGIPNSPSQKIPDMPNWRQIWGSGRPRKGSNSAETVLPYRERQNIVLLKNGSRESLHEWK
ncbi:hypothetical protein TNCV_1911861 [Trichonephila clavipes]|nr:hypothetical protein TNCV_1911861 [Trichonephila clavipes]